MIKVVHITAHLGGGIGRILSSIAIYSQIEKEVEHVIVTLEKTENSHFEQLLKEHSIKVFLQNQCCLKQILQEADIVEVDWWHHPLTSAFMHNYFNDIECRLLIWSHVSGCTYPYIKYELIKCADKFVFSTPFSFENEYWSNEEKEEVMKRVEIIVSSGIDFDAPVKKKPHHGYNVGYIGFLSYSKTHPDFVRFLEAAADIPDICFKVVGDTAYGKELIKDVQNSKLVHNKVIFEGYALDVKEKFAEFDVFGYPLNPMHYGTAENALLEAMAAGVVPVVLNQCTEKYMVRHMETGIIVNSIEEYGAALRWLKDNADKRIHMGNNASEFVIKKLHIRETVNRLNACYSDMMSQNKRLHDIYSAIGTNPYEWFVSAYWGDVNCLEGNSFAETKGSAKHYLRYFPEDKILRKVVETNESRI